MRCLTGRIIFSLWLSLGLLTSCAGNDLEFQGLTKSGQFEERVEQMRSPIFNCQSRTATVYTVQRQRTVEKSVDIQVGGEVQASLSPEVLASKIGELSATIGAQYGWTTAEARTDSSSLQLTVNAGEQAIYMIEWHERWERGEVRVARGGQSIPLTYFYLTAAQPQIGAVFYPACNEQGYATATAMALALNPTAILAPTATDVPPPTSTEQPTLTPLPEPTYTAIPAPPLADASKPPLNASIGTSWTEPTSGIEFVYVPAGEFVMGSSTQQIQDAFELCKNYRSDCSITWYDDEKPQHRVTTIDYWMGKTEITNAQFRQFMDKDGYNTDAYWTMAGWKWRNDNKVSQPNCWTDSDFKGDKQPVVCVSWYEAMAYTKWLSQATGLRVRLPTEAEWEKAARGPDGLIYPWGNKFDGNKVNYCDSNCEYDWKDKSINDGYAKTAPVGNYLAGASPYGVLDMAGNVWEWNSSLYKAYPYEVSDGREDLDAEGSRLLRGGAWDLNPNFVRGAYRFRRSPDNRENYVGFRLVLAVAPGG